MFKKKSVAKIVLIILSAVLIAKTAAAGDGKIQDNSFLAEEAYNQEDGVIQHIQTFQYEFGGFFIW